MRTLRRASGVQGFNIGMNQGVVAGAGIAAHLHQHVVPRWAGDANFLPVIGQTKALPQLLDQTWQVVTEAWRRFEGSGSVEGARSGDVPGSGDVDEVAGDVEVPVAPGGEV